MSLTLDQILALKQPETLAECFALLQLPETTTLERVREQVEHLNIEFKKYSFVHEEPINDRLNWLAIAENRLTDYFEQQQKPETIQTDSASDFEINLGEFDLSDRQTNPEPAPAKPILLGKLVINEPNDVEVNAQEEQPKSLRRKKIKKGISVLCPRCDISFRLTSSRLLEEHIECPKCLADLITHREVLPDGTEVIVAELIQVEQVTTKEDDPTAMVIGCSILIAMAIGLFCIAVWIARQINKFMSSDFFDSTGGYLIKMIIWFVIAGIVVSFLSSASKKKS